MKRVDLLFGFLGMLSLDTCILSDRSLGKNERVLIAMLACAALWFSLKTALSLLNYRR